MGLSQIVSWREPLLRWLPILGQTRVSLPEQLISDHRHILTRGEYQPLILSLHGDLAYKGRELDLAEPESNGLFLILDRCVHI